MPNNVVQYVLSLKDLFSEQIKKANAETEKLEGNVNKTQNALSSLGGIAATAFATMGVAKFASDVLQVGQNFENAEMGLTTLLKSGEKAREVFGNIQEDATKTPFDFQSLLMANKALIAAGADASDARSSVLNLANAIAATGGGNDELQRMVINMQQIKNTGKATALDIKQFAYAGINIYGLLAEATGKSTKEVQDMEVSYETLTYALQKAASEGGLYFNGLNNAMNTTQGQISNLGDQFDLLKNDIFKSLQPAISSVISGLSSMIAFVRENKAEIAAFSIVVVGLVAAYNSMAIIQSVLAVKTAIMTIAQWNLNAAMAANPIGLLIIGISALIAGIVYAYNKSETFRRGLNAVWEVIKGTGMAIWDYLIMPLKIVTNLASAAYHALTGNFGKAKEDLRAIGDAVTAPFKDMVVGVRNAEKEWNKKDTKTKTKTLVTAAKNVTENKTIVTPPQASTGKTSTASAARSSQPTIINISINKMIESQIVKVENATKDFVPKIQQAVSEALLMAVNDANRIATQ